jgi:hypothetical protein
MLNRREKIIIALVCIAIIILIYIIFIQISTIDKHFMQYLQGFWIHNSNGSKCILYVAKNTIRIISTGSEVSNEKLNVKFNSKTWFDMYLRRYGLSASGENIRGKYSKLLTQSGIFIDMYPTEGTLIVNDSTGDLVTFVKDNYLNLEFNL